MKKLFASILCFLMICNTSAMALNDTESVEENYNIITLKTVQLSDIDEYSLIKLEEGESVTVITPEGEEVEYTLFVEDSAKSTSKRLSVQSKYSTPLYHTYVTLWADGVWDNRYVTIANQGISYLGTNVGVQNPQSWIVNKTGSFNDFAKVRTTGEIIWYWISAGVPGGSSNWDFELWLDPANSESAYLHYNDFNHN